jgi:tetratricopeptide (TPR) repeat protein
VRMENRGQMSEVRGQESEVRSQMSEVRSQKGVMLAALALLLAGCAAPKAEFTDADWVSHTTTGRGAYERGDYRRAADAYGRAQQRARALDDADALAVAAANRAICRLAEGEAAGALEAVMEALADPRVSALRRSELRAAGARALLALGRTDEAVAMADAALEGKPGAAVRAQVQLVRGAAALSREDPAAAAQALAEGLSAGEWARMPASIRAERAAQRGQVAEMDGRHAVATGLHDESAALWLQAGRLPEMARAVAEAGRRAHRAGDPAGAADRFFRAARSLWAQGFRVEAASLLEEGVACSEQAGDEAVARRMADLLVTFQRDMRPHHIGAAGE